MNRDLCAFVDTWLDEWLAGGLAPDVANRIAAHVAVCERCSRLAAIVKDAEARPADDDVNVDLLASVLSRTTGSACSQAELLLPAMVDDDLDAASRDLLRDHVSHCSGCARLRAVLEESRAVLPSLAELATPPGFVHRVLAATSRLEQQSAFAQWWLRILARPRASLELAYIATVLIVALFGNPVSAFEQARGQAERLAAVVPVSRLSEQLPASAQAVGTVARFLNPLASAATAVMREMSAWWQRAVDWLDAVQTAIRDAIVWVKNVDVAKLMRDASEILRARGQPTVADQPQK